ncbi:MAG: hypothetical protein AB7S26_10415 [Sandaracinaceae bacterium]
MGTRTFHPLADRRARITPVIAAALATLLTACGADIGERGTSLVVDEGFVTGEVLYVLPDVSQVPFTAREIQALGFDESQAIPVRVEIFEDIAVAWFAPDGNARIGREWIVALWRVQRTTMSRTIADGLVQSGEPSIVAAPSTSNATSNAASNGHDATAAVLAEGVDGYDIELRTETQSAAEVTVIEFRDRLGTPEELSMLEELYLHHPGC